MENAVPGGRHSKPDGTLTVTDKRSQQVYQRLLTFEDRADIGDGWNYGPAVNDQAFFSTGSRTSLALVANGPYRATFRLRTGWKCRPSSIFAR